MSFKRMVSYVVPTGTLMLSMAVVVGLSVPANAINQPATSHAGELEATAAAAGSAPQSLVVAAADVAGAARDGYTVTDPPPPPPKIVPQPAARSFAPLYSNIGGGAVRWPFPNPVRISDGFGYRPSPCAGCSSDHKGTDFDAGNGAPIYAIADGVVSVSTSSGGYGTHVYIDHTINGQSIRSLYAHMQYGSSPLAAGQSVKVGDFVGLVGATGNVTGAHLHFELAVNGVNVDPYAWLQANAG